MLCLSLRALGRNLLSVTFPYPRSLPHVTLLDFLLVPNLSPYHLSTTVLLSGSPAFCDGEESFSPLSVLVPLVFPNAFFASLLISYCCSLWVLLDPGLLILLVSHLCPCLFPLFSPSCILHSLPIAILLPGCFGKNGFPGLCFSLLAFLCGSLCDLGRNHTKPIIRLLRYIPLPWVPTICYPTCLSTSPQLVSLSSLHYRASFQVSSIWDGEESFYPLSFLSLLVALVFPTAFFTSLLTTVVLFRCFWDPRFSLSPTCV